MAAKFNYIAVSDAIFKNRQIYEQIPDSDRDVTFFWFNRKIASTAKTLPISQSLNSRFIDKASALDFWYTKFKGATSAPQNWWIKIDTEKKKEKSIPKADITLLKKVAEIEDERDLDFLLKYYKSDVDSEIKKYKKFEYD